jgi:hypothetical protein
MASNLYTFNTSVLSSGKFSNPPQVNLSLSASGVNVISLSGPVMGVAFNSRSPLTTQLTNVTVLGSVFRIDWAYNGDTMLAIIPSTGNLAFRFLSGSSTVTAASAVSEFSAPDQQRKRQLGYF